MNKKINILRPLNDSEARLLLVRFEAGETSLEEEQTLYAYFHRRDLPADMRALRGLMSWYEGGCVGEPFLEEPVSAKKHTNRFRQILLSAASVALLVALGFAAFTLTGRSAAESSAEEFAELYRGSYVIRNGEKITDPALIRDDIMRARHLTDSINQLIAMRTDRQHLLESAVERRIGAANPRTMEKIMNTITQQ